jgi:hypothetical protein
MIFRALRECIHHLSDDLEISLDQRINAGNNAKKMPYRAVVWVVWTGNRAL